MERVEWMSAFYDSDRVVKAKDSCCRDTSSS